MVATYSDPIARLGASVSIIDDAAVIGSIEDEDAQGLIAVFTGADGASSVDEAAARHDGDAPGAALGWSVTPVGDTDGDGLEDVVVYLHGMQLLRSEDLYVDEGIVNATPLGYSVGRQARQPVDGIGDADGDGLADLAATTWEAETPDIRVVSGGDVHELASIYTDDDLAWNFADVLLGIGDPDDDGAVSFVGLTPDHDTDAPPEVLLYEAPFCGTVEAHEAGRALDLPDLPHASRLWGGEQALALTALEGDDLTVYGWVFGG